MLAPAVGPDKEPAPARASGELEWHMEALLGGAMEQRLILDRYRPLAELGEGGHGSVVLAYDTRMARRVAIKRLPLPSDGSGMRSRRGLQEARMAALLNHPNIVTVHEWDTDPDEAFLIMEYLDGLSVAELLDRTRGPLDLDEVAALLDAVANALTFGHGNGLLHLDIKPENVLITREGQVKVTDFGVAALTGPGGRASASGGTFGHMPLEQLMDDTVDERTDEWALAALVYEALTYSNPFDASDIESAILNVELLAIPPPSQIRARLPAGVDDPLMTALDPHKGGRFPTVSEFAGSLLPHLGDPMAGRESLATVVNALAEEWVVDAEREVGLWDRLLVRSSVVRRLAAAAAATWLTWLGASSAGLTFAAHAAVVAMVAAVSLLAPGLGLAMGLSGVVVATGLSLGWAVAAPVSLALALYWWFLGREGRGHATVPVVAPVLAWAWAGMAGPMLIGFSLTPLMAAASSALTATAILVASFGSASPPPYLSVHAAYLVDPWSVSLAVGNPLTVLLQPGAWVVVASWAAAGAAMSALSAGATRAGAFGGIAAALALQLTGYLAWSTFDPSFAMTDPDILWQAMGSLILMSLVVAAGPPARGEG